MIKLKGSYLQKTALGYYKTSFMILKNAELYLYDDQYNMELEQMLILSPGVFVNKIKEINISSNSIRANPNHKISKVYPVELYMGG